ncbi:hypothetical protein [Photobacterium sp. 1_MG-2023]|uniref:hypothetical protein n=1 Tax=Photobacterium sp. 1_MG-2023 TaxID=3062646 RepID=UPI0026E12A56|nr:hypothetical protein [Photobacterium sp. 1_MG-2023]MDO6706622.1 hypothetical protein [Photobacterium sp. 1_MG-2023]
MSITQTMSVSMQCVSAVLAGSFLLTSGQAVAADNEPDAHFTCSGSGSQSYNPGLILLARPVNMTNEASFPSCTGNTVASATSATPLFTDHLNADCLTLSPGGHHYVNYVWDDGTKSLFVGTTKVSRQPTQITVSSSGTFTAGRFAGHPVEAVITYPAPAFPPYLLSCLAEPGLTSLSGPTSVTVLPIL